MSLVCDSQVLCCSSTGVFEGKASSKYVLDGIHCASLSISSYLGNWQDYWSNNRAKWDRCEFMYCPCLTGWGFENHWTVLQLGRKQDLDSKPQFKSG